MARTPVITASIACPKVPLGQSSVCVSRLGFGLKSTLLRNTDVLVEALDRYEIDFWDSTGNTLRHIARALERVDRSRVVICAKTSTMACTAEHASRNIGEVLGGLQTSYLDIGLLFYVLAGELPTRLPALRQLVRLKEEGVLRAVGLSTHCPAVALRAACMDEVEILCVPVNYRGLFLEGGTLADMLRALELAAARGKGTYAVKALGAGQLASNLPRALGFASSLPFVHSISVAMRNLDQVGANLELLCSR